MEQISESSFPPKTLIVEKTYPLNHRKLWTEEEDKLLLELRNQTIQNLAQRFERTPFAIFSRFLHLSRVGYDQNILETTRKLYEFFKISDKSSSDTEKSSEEEDISVQTVD